MSGFHRGLTETSSRLHIIDCDKNSTKITVQPAVAVSSELCVSCCPLSHMLLSRVFPNPGASPAGTARE